MEDDNSTKVKAEKLKQILKEEYNIHNQAEFEKSIEESHGLDIGIFVSPLDKKV